MKQEENYKISFAESALRGKQIIAQQPAVTFAQAFQQRSEERRVGKEC